MNLFNQLDPIAPMSAALYEAARNHDPVEVDRLLEHDRAATGDPDQHRYATPVQICPFLIELLSSQPDRFVMPIDRPIGANERETLDRFHLCVSPEGHVVIDRGEVVIEWDWAFTSILPADISARALANWLTMSSVQDTLARMIEQAHDPAGAIRCSERLYAMVSDLPRVNRIPFEAVCEMFEHQFEHHFDPARCDEPLTAADLLDEAVSRETFAPHVVHVAPPDCLQRRWKPFLVEQFLHTGCGLPYSVVAELHRDGLLEGALIDQLARNAINLLHAETLLGCIEDGCDPDVRAANRQPIAHVMRTAEQLIRLRDLGGDLFATDNLGETALNLAELRLEGDETSVEDQRVVSYLRAVRDQQVLSEVVRSDQASRTRRLM